MGTEEIFQLLERRSKETVERIRILEIENKRLKMQNSEFITQKERASEKVRELLHKLCISDG